MTNNPTNPTPDQGEYRFTREQLEKASKELHAMRVTTGTTRQQLIDCLLRHSQEVKPEPQQAWATRQVNWEHSTITLPFEAGEVLDEFFGYGADPQASPAAGPPQLKATCAICGEPFGDKHECKAAFSEIEMDMTAVMMHVTACDHYCCGLAEYGCQGRTLLKVLEDSGYELRKKPESDPSLEEGYYAMKPYRDAANRTMELGAEGAASPETLATSGGGAALRKALENVRAIAEGTPDAWTALSQIGNTVHAALTQPPAPNPGGEPTPAGEELREKVIRVESQRNTVWKDREPWSEVVIFQRGGAEYVLLSEAEAAAAQARKERDELQPWLRHLDTCESTLSFKFDHKENVLRPVSGQLPCDCGLAAAIEKQGGKQ